MAVTFDKWIKRVFMLALVAGALTATQLLSACNGESGQTTATGSGQELVVYAASPMQPLLEKLAPGFGEARLSFNFGHIPSLLAQLREGSPGDVIATPDEQSMKQAVDAGLVEGAPVVFAVDELAVVVPAGNPAGISSLADLTRSDVRVAVCAPDLPCGKLAQQLFSQAGVDVRPVTAEPGGVGAILTKLSVGEVDAGIVFRAGAAAQVAAGKVAFLDVPAAAALKVSLSAAALKEAANPVAARAFVGYLASGPAAQIVQESGYRKP